MKNDIFNYINDSNSYLNEFSAIDGSIKPSWSALFSAMSEISPEQLLGRQEKALKILYDDGASYNNYRLIQSQSQSNTQGSTQSQTQTPRYKNQPWSLDLLPHLIENDDWQTIESGLKQRAELFNLVFSDLYGERKLISEGIIPPELVYGNSGFLRECNNIRLPGEHQLVVHAADILRRENGEICVLTDRVQAPSGFGYSLENRIVMNRVMPSLFKGNNVHRLANFFQQFRKKIISLASDVSLPRIVMLTPGLYNETYFEHAFLANYLGFSLVQGNDLVVKDGFVWIRSVEGLSKIDVIIRRVDDDYCDPVELRPDSQLGVPGLLQVARAGNVAIVNPFGSGVMENPALLAYLPEIAKYFLGSDLKLNSVKTWWCNDPEHYQQIKASFDQLVITKVDRKTNDKNIEVSKLNDEERAQLITAIEDAPQDYVAQEKIIPAQVPALIKDKIENRSALMRCFAVAGEENTYDIMPGGMTRISTQEQSAIISDRLGTFSKDTWVLSDHEKDSILSSQSYLNADYTQGLLLPSRVIENLFWMGRYAERAEHNLRLLRTVFTQFNGVKEVPEQSKVLLLHSITKSTTTYPGFIDNQSLLQSPRSELLSIILDQDRFGSISQAIHSLTHDTNQLKGSLSPEVMKVMSNVNEQFEQLRQELTHHHESCLEHKLDPIISSLLALSGITHENMFRDSGWYFLDLGRRIERVTQISILLRSLLFVPLNDQNESIILESIGMSTDSLVPYQRLYGNALKAEFMLDVLISNQQNPRSLSYQIHQILNSMESMPEHQKGSITSELTLVKEALTLLTNIDVKQLRSASTGGANVREELDQFCSRINYLMSEISQQLSDKYFLSAEKMQHFN